MTPNLTGRQQQKNLRSKNHALNENAILTDCYGVPTVRGKNRRDAIAIICVDMDMPGRQCSNNTLDLCRTVEMCSYVKMQGSLSKTQSMAEFTDHEAILSCTTKYGRIMRVKVGTNLSAFGRTAFVPVDHGHC